MSIATVHSIAPVASLTASSSSSDSGSSSLLFIALAVIAGIWIISLLGSSGATVVVVEKPAGSIFGFALIALALGILYFVYLAPASGSI